MPSVAYGILPFISYFDQDTIALVNGEAFFYSQVDRQPKPVFQDPAGTVEFSNPLSYDSAGRLPPLYFETDVPYFIVVQDSLGRIVDTVQNFAPTTGGITPVTVEKDYDNLLINGQFRFQSQTIYTPAPSAVTLVAPNAYYFQKNGSGATDTLQFIKFSNNANQSDNSSPTQTPIYFLNYICTQAATGLETFKTIEYRIKDVRSLCNEPITISVGGASLDAQLPTLGVTFRQYFGTGGAPSNTVNTAVGNIALTAQWQTFRLPLFTVPGIPGTTIGTNQDDYVSIVINLPLNTTCNIGITNMYVKLGESTQFYPYETYAETEAQINALIVPTPTREQSQDVLQYQNSKYNAVGTIGWGESVPIAFTMPSECDIEIPEIPNFSICNGQMLNKWGLYKILFNRMGYKRTSLNGFSTVANGTTAINFTADNVGVNPTAPTVATGTTLSAYVVGTSTTRQTFTLTFGAGTLYTTGTAFTVTSATIGAALTTTYTIIFNVGGGYITPPVVANPIIINILAADTAIQVTTKVLAALQFPYNNGLASNENLGATVATNTVTVTNLKLGTVHTPSDAHTSGFTVTTITPGSTTAYNVSTVATIAITSAMAGRYFTIATNTKNICFWFMVDNVGTQPVAVFDQYIPLLFTSGMTANAAAAYIQSVLNWCLIALPNYQGIFLRGAIPALGVGAQFNADPGPRYVSANGSNGTGTSQYDTFQSHSHTLTPVHSWLYDANPGGNIHAENGSHAAYSGITVNNTGGFQTTPRNDSVNYFIRTY